MSCGEKQYHHPTLLYLYTLFHSLVVHQNKFHYRPSIMYIHTDFSHLNGM
jgi:hypothetical protein